MLELFQHHHEIIYATDSRFRLTNNSNISLKLRIAILPVGSAEKTVSDTRAAIANARASRTGMTGKVASHGRLIKSTASEHRAAQTAGATVR